MQALINDLLTYSRVGRAGGHTAQVDLNALVDRAIVNLTRAVEETGATVTRDDLPSVWGDPSQLGQLFQNLIANAIKFRAESSPTVRVSGHRAGEVAEIAVTDNGIGIDVQHQ